MVSVIVPLYRRVEFIEHQLAQFVHDDDFHRVDLIYVLDSPELADFLLPQARRLARLYQVPFRLAILNRNGGFSMANNLGATLARSRLLVLLNSDVLPDKPGWLGTMARFYDSKADIGALGVKLLYEDESLQHAGLYFVRPPGETVWFNEHYFKGLHRDFGPANEVRRVPAVTAACLMIASDLYSDVGGLQGHYIQGDYEDSDLCLRLSERGLTNWYLPSVELYHLEGQSYPTDARTRNASFNRWLHSVDWSDRISTVMSGLQDHGSENRALAQRRSALGLAPDRTDPPSPKREQTRKRTAS
jgi:GT2 family glycosyltransferase